MPSVSRKPTGGSLDVHGMAVPTSGPMAWPFDFGYLHHAAFKPPASSLPAARFARLRTNSQGSGSSSEEDGNDDFDSFERDERGDSVGRLMGPLANLGVAPPRGSGSRVRFELTTDALIVLLEEGDKPPPPIGTPPLPMPRTPQASLENVGGGPAAVRGKSLAELEEAKLQEDGAGDEGEGVSCYQCLSRSRDRRPVQARAVPIHLAENGSIMAAGTNEVGGAGRQG